MASEAKDGRGALAALTPYLPRGRIAVLLAAGIASSLSEGLGLLLLAPMLDLATHGTASGLAASLGRLGLPARLDVMLVIFVVLVTLRALLVQWRLVMETQVRLQLADELRQALFQAILRADWRYLATIRQGALLSLTTNLADRAGFALQFLLGLVAALFTLATLLGTAMLIAPLPALVAGLGGAVVLVLYAGIRHRAAQDGHAMASRFATFHDFFTERVDALRVIKSLGKSAEEATRGRAIARGLAEAQLRYQRGIALGQIALQAGAAIALAGAVWLAIEHWQVPVIALLPLVALFARSVPLFAAVQAGWQQYAHHAAAILDVKAELEAAQAHAEPLADTGTQAPRLASQITLDQVSVHFDGRDLPSLDRVSLTIPAGSVCFLTGPSGAGKSTLADLLAGLTRPDSGAVKIDGQPLEGPTWTAWRSHVAYVQQEPLLFDASLRENLLWAAPGADEALLRSCLERGSAGFVFDLPQGLDTRVGTSGRQLSGGERQRIVLARALLRDPDLLILDEATAALDRENEARIAEAVAALKGQVTVIIIGHGGQLAALADQTLQLENGRIVG